MSSGVIKKIERREYAASQVVSVVKGQEEAVAEALTLRLSPLLEAGEAMPDVRLLVKLLVREEQQRILALTEASQAHDAELSDDIVAELVSVPIAGWLDEDGEQVCSAIVAQKNPLGFLLDICRLRMILQDFQDTSCNRLLS